MKRLIYIFFAVLLIMNSGCKREHLDINQNPNAATTGSVTPQLILPRIQLAAASEMAVNYDWTARWMGYWARSGTYGPSQEEESYNISTTFEQGRWNAWYDLLFDAHTMEQKAAALGADYDFYRGIAKVYKSVGFMYLVDMYGNVPYTKAFDLANNLTPTYDNGQEIYADLLKQLDEAVTFFKGPADEQILKLSSSDVMFGGNATMWLKLANTQRLKLLLRQSQVPGFNPAPEIAKITAEGFLMSGESAEVQPGFQTASTNPSTITQQNPYFENYKTLYTNIIADNYNRANNYILGLFRTNNDPRYTRVFSPVPTACANCNPPVTAGSYFGFDYGQINTDPNQPKAANSSDVAGPGLVSSAQDPIWFFTSVESMFLQAEAIARGWLPGDAKMAYENAVRESFLWLGLSNAQATTYINSAEAIVDWNAATNKINLIVTQKYLSLIGINNFEAWVDYRRLGVPNVPKSLAPSASGNVIPLRLRYPQTEYNYNAANVATQGNPDPKTTGVFWDK